MGCNRVYQILFCLYHVIMVKKFFITMKEYFKSLYTKSVIMISNCLQKIWLVYKIQGLIQGAGWDG